jgi:predicted nucleotidyltransferase component of viral defense system
MGGTKGWLPGNLKDYLFQIINPVDSAVFSRNKVREYLQALILAGLQKSSAMVSCAFHGGTALRFLYGLPRFSEDLDFALEKDQKHFDFTYSLKLIKKELVRNGFTVNIRARTDRIVQSAYIHFPGLLYDLQLSQHLTESLAIKIEIDTRPPAGATVKTTVITRYVTLNLLHHDPASLFAGKLNAILTRGFSKGRDWYDLLWYLSNPDWPAPNLTLLKNAYRQKVDSALPFESTAWRDHILKKAETLDFDRIRADVSPFLEDDRESEMLDVDSFQRLLIKR